jgi:hypothetical protein
MTDSRTDTIPSPAATSADRDAAVLALAAAQQKCDAPPKLSTALTARYGRGFSRRNLEQMRAFYLAWANPQALSALSSRTPKTQTPSALSPTPSFPLPWSHYVRLLSVRSAAARAFYEAEALRGGWTIRQLMREDERLELASEIIASVDGPRDSDWRPPGWPSSIAEPTQREPGARRPRSGPRCGPGS